MLFRSCMIMAYLLKIYFLICMYYIQLDRCKDPLAIRMLNLISKDSYYYCLLSLSPHYLGDLQSTLNLSLIHQNCTHLQTQCSFDSFLKSEA